MIKSEPVQAVRLTLLCDKCGLEMVNRGMMYPTAPPQYPYWCTRCGFEMVARHWYPRVDFVEIEEDAHG